MKDTEFQKKTAELDQLVFFKVASTGNEGLWVPSKLLKIQPK